MPDVAGHLRRRYLAIAPRRRWLVPVLAVEAALLGVSAMTAALPQPDTTPHPERVSTRVESCDLGTRGAAQVSFRLSNADRDGHNYQVHLVVKGSGPGNLGAGTTLVNHVDPGATVTGRMLVPVNGDVSGATCTLWAEVFSSDVGHHA